MKFFTSYFIIIFCLISLIQNESNSQICEDCICGISDIQVTGYEPDTIIGGRYKPARSDFNNTDPLAYFPILVVFVQFKNESGDSTTAEFNSWPARRPPNYIDSVIRSGRNSLTYWWDAYNGYDVSDYWHEFSRGKLHILGEAISVILPYDTTWYMQNGGHAKINKDIYDTLKQIIGINWPFYDKWKYNADGNFSYEPDQRVDMMYLVFRTRFRSDTFAPRYYGYAALGPCQGADSLNDYEVYHSGSTFIKINGVQSTNDFQTIGKGSGVIVYGGGNSLYSRYIFLDLVTHEHGHYLFGYRHATYCKMSYGVGYGGGWEFSFSPWEVVKLGFIKQKIANYSNSDYQLYDYSSRGGTAGDSGEVLQVPISSDGKEFFLLANRRKESKWDRRMAGDTLADDRWEYLKNINEEYGKGLYIYHIKGGYEFLDPNSAGEKNDMDIECADGLWKWDSTNISRQRINTGNPEKVIVKSYPVYNNDNPDPDITSYVSGKDEMSKGIIFSQGSADQFNPLSRGTTSLYTNDNDYWYSFAVMGDRWDAWNVGYNEMFSPYSSPSTNAMDNSNTGIFVWYQSFDQSNNKATLKIYRTQSGGLTEDSILHLTPPSRPMGLRVLSCDSLPTIYGLKRIKIRWNHNMEPDMANLVQGYQSYTKEYKIYRSTAEDMNSVPPDAMQYPEQYYEENCNCIY